MIILAFDSGLEKTGYGIFDLKGSNVIYKTSGLIKTESKLKVEKRLSIIHDKIENIIHKSNPNKIIIESIFFFKNQKTVISVSQAQGVILLLAAQNGISVDFLTPLQIKKAVTGFGQADKLSVRKMVNIILKINKTIKEDDEIDAIACGLAYCYLFK